MLTAFESYIDLHKGEKALVCGNGCSIRDLSPDFYYGWDGPTYGVNRIRYWFDEPTYYFNIYTLQDRMCHNGRLIDFHWNTPVTRVDTFRTGRLSLDTIGLTAMTAAFQMGCAEIYLIGIDFAAHPDGGVYFYNQNKSRHDYLKDSRRKKTISIMNRAISMMKECGTKFFNLSEYSAVKV